jgi:hypothetical protein
MKNKRFRGLLLFSLSLAVMVMACGLGGTSEPTALPPTNTPAPPPPTEAPPPTEVPTEPPPEPTEVPPTEIPEPTPEPEAPAEVYVSSLASYQDQYDSWHVVGLITNNTDRAVDDVEVEIEAFDTSENSIYLEVARSALYSLAPGETSPFVHWVFDDLEDFDHFTASIVGQSSADLDRIEIEVRGTPPWVLDDDGNIHITGELYNPNEEPVEIGGIAAATFDADGNLITADNYAVSIRYLDPDEAGPFRITMTGPAVGAENIDTYTIYLDVEVSPGEQLWDLAFVEDHNNYMDYYDSFHLVGEVTNNSEEALNISLIAAIYDTEGNVLDASSTSLPISALPSGEMVAYDFDVWGPLNYHAATIDSADSYTVQWDPYWTWTSSREYVDLVTQNTIEDFDEGDGKITGEVLNNSGGLVDGAIVIVTFYDTETGAIYATSYDSLWDEIPDGETDIFEIWFDLETDFDRDAYEYTIIVKGELP